MDNLNEQLRKDAAAIAAEVSAEDRQRLDALLAATPQVSTRHRPAAGLRWAALAAGLGALALVVLLPNATPPVSDDVPVAATPIYQPVPAALLTVPLRVEPAHLTEPLQQELNDLRADVARAKESIERDLRVTF